MLTYVDSFKALPVEEGNIVDVILGIEMVWDESPIIAGRQNSVGAMNLIEQKIFSKMVGRGVSRKQQINLSKLRRERIRSMSSS